MRSITGNPISMKVSVVIIAKNEAAYIKRCVASALCLCDDVIVADTGSTDDTEVLAKSAGAKVLNIPWQGYGKTKNAATQHARYEWVFSLDADEEITPALAAEIQNLQPADGDVYRVRRTGFFKDRRIRHGAWRDDYVTRLYNRRQQQWDESDVHEKITPVGGNISTLKGILNHYTAKSLVQFTDKNIQYAHLWAQNAFKNGKKPSAIKQYISPLFNFLGGYIIKLGFLDGIEGYWIAKVNAYYTFMKYALLREIHLDSGRARC